MAWQWRFGWRCGWHGNGEADGMAWQWRCDADGMAWQWWCDADGMALWECSFIVLVLLVRCEFFINYFNIIRASLKPLPELSWLESEFDILSLRVACEQPRPHRGPTIGSDSKLSQWQLCQYKTCEVWAGADVYVLCLSASVPVGCAYGRPTHLYLHKWQREWYTVHKKK